MCKKNVFKLVSIIIIYNISIFILYLSNTQKYTLYTSIFNFVTFIVFFFKAGKIQVKLINQKHIDFNF